MCGVTLSIGLLVALARVAGATSYGKPVEHDVPSPNGAFVVHVDPKSQNHAIRARGMQAAAWAFTRAMQFEDVVVADDGKAVAVIAWRFVRLQDLDEPAVEIWNATGRVHVFTVRELVARPAHTRGTAPLGAFWRQWRSSVDFDGKRLAVHTTGPWAYEIDLATGTIDRSLGVGAIAWVSGLGAAALAFVMLWLAMRWRRSFEYASDKRRVVTAASAPIIAAFSLWCYLTGEPLPAEVAGTAAFVLWLASLVALPFSLLALARLGGTMRAGFLVAALALTAVPIALRIF